MRKVARGARLALADLCDGATPALAQHSGRAERRAARSSA